LKIGEKIELTMKQEWNKKTLWVLALAIAFFFGGVAFYWFSMHNHHSMEYQNKSQHHAQHLKHHKHDEVNMPGLQGEDITDQEVADLKQLFQKHDEISRLVENIPNGIITVTETDNEELRSSIIDHVSMMVTRLQEEKNPQVIIQSPTLHEIFKYYDEIETEIELTEKGISVIQTSDNQEVVALLQQHASEISDMVDRGMQAVHERMMASSHQYKEKHHHQGDDDDEYEKYDDHHDDQD
jgi:cell division septal protein FtsQ